jgi:GNAT superfamily N-acetyltransferase
MECYVRPAVPGDLSAILSLLSEMHNEKRSGDPTEHEIKLFKRVLVQPLRTLLVAEVEGQVVGTADVIVVENLSRNGRSWAMVENFVVTRKLRKRGYGKELMLRAIRISEDLGCYKIQLVSNERRAQAHELYRHLGFDAPVRGFRRYLES